MLGDNVLTPQQSIGIRPLQSMSWRMMRLIDGVEATLAGRGNELVSTVCFQCSPESGAKESGAA